MHKPSFVMKPYVMTPNTEFFGKEYSNLTFNVLCNMHTKHLQPDNLCGRKFEVLLVYINLLQIADILLHDYFPFMGNTHYRKP